MKGGGGVKGSLSPALITGGLALAAAAVLFLFQAYGAALLPLAAFVLLCLMAPFFVTPGFFLPIISRGHTGRAVVSLTFDDGPDPVTTPLLLQLLERHNVKAAFFVTGENADRYGNLVSAILAQGHDIGNHSYHHDIFLMLRPSGVLTREIASTQVLLGQFGIAPLVFRPPVGITSPRLAAALREQGLVCLTFSCRAGDFGNRRLAGLSRKVLNKVAPDAIILLHDIRPPGKNDAQPWLQEVDLILSGLRQKGLAVIPLAELIERPVMIRVDQKG